MSNINIEFLMTQTNKIPFIAPTHNHPGFELVYYMQGTGTTTINHREYSYYPGCYTIIEPKQQHNEFAQSDTEIIYFVFSNSNLTDLPLKSGLYHDTQESDVIRLLFSMKEEMMNRKLYYKRRLEILAEDILILHFRNCGNSPQQLLYSDTNDLLDNPLKYIDVHFHQNIDMVSLAELTGYSYDRLRHIFKEKLGISPKQYVTKKRLSHAKKMLQQTDKPLGEIGESCGFSSANFFIKVFKESTGITPSQYRNYCRSNVINIEYADT